LVATYAALDGGSDDRKTIVRDESREADEDRLRRAFHIDRFIDHLRFERGASERTVAAYEHDVVRLAVHCSAAGRSDPSTATTRDLRALVLRLKDVGLAPTSISR